ncbi:hypothetical protein DPMN_085088 [Dreissena polymorpha]|uniref:Uncharacterized protein n=1 Tax=Dreissena polymorpha TaxID=45954 RepID=A0A9D4BJ42_DREPO|nr:hypothetical protein DPMN_085088 [Dreissena polymorpha]
MEDLEVLRDMSQQRTLCTPTAASLIAVPLYADSVDKSLRLSNESSKDDTTDGLSVGKNIMTNVHVESIIIHSSSSDSDAGRTPPPAPKKKKITQFFRRDK